MHPPAHVCKELFRLHKWLRLAWAGRPPAYEGELNPGSFAVVQLYHKRDAGHPDCPVTYREFWEATPQMGEDGTVRTVRASRGPLFNRNGRVSLDYDPWIRTPIYVIDVKNPQDVFSGKFLLDTKRSLEPIVKRVISSAQAKGKRIQDSVDDLGREMAEYLWYEGNKTGESYSSTAWEFAKRDLTPNFKRRLEGRKLFDDAFVVRPPRRA